jgi:hypothetical protein
MPMIRRPEFPAGPENVEHTVAIRDGREGLGELSLDTNGFVLSPHETAAKDFSDPDEVESVYYPEVERLLKRVTGADRVLIFDHIARNPVLAERGEKGLLATRMASPNLPRGWRKPLTPIVTADHASKTRSRCARIESANRTGRETITSIVRACGGMRKKPVKSGLIFVIRERCFTTHLDVAKLNIMFSSDGLEIGTGCSGAPRSAGAGADLRGLCRNPQATKGE